MTPAEAVKKMDALVQRKQQLFLKIAVAARAVVPVLLDASRAHSAKELQELLFEVDAIEQEAKDIIQANISTEFLELMLRRAGGA